MKTINKQTSAFAGWTLKEIADEAHDQALYYCGDSVVNRIACEQGGTHRAAIEDFAHNKLYLAIAKMGIAADSSQDFADEVWEAACDETVLSVEELVIDERQKGKNDSTR